MQEKHVIWHSPVIHLIFPPFARRTAGFKLTILPVQIYWCCLTIAMLLEANKICNPSTGSCHWDKNIVNGYITSCQHQPTGEAVCEQFMALHWFWCLFIFASGANLTPTFCHRILLSPFAIFISKWMTLAWHTTVIRAKVISILSSAKVYCLLFIVPSLPKIIRIEDAHNK